MKKKRQKNQKKKWRNKKANTSTQSKSVSKKQSSLSGFLKDARAFILKFKWLLSLGTIFSALVAFLNLFPQIEITSPNLERGIFEGKFDIKNNSFFALTNVKALKGLYNFELGNKKFSGPSVYTSKNIGDIPKGENANIIWEENRANLSSADSDEDFLEMTVISANNKWDSAELCVQITYDYFFLPFFSPVYRGFSYNKRVNPNEWIERPKVCTEEIKEEIKRHMDFIRENIPEKNFD